MGKGACRYLPFKEKTTQIYIFITPTYNSFLNCSSYCNVSFRNVLKSTISMTLTDNNIQWRLLCHRFRQHWILEDFIIYLFIYLSVWLFFFFYILSFLFHGSFPWQRLVLSSTPYISTSIKLESRCLQINWSRKPLTRDWNRASSRPNWV